MLATGAGGIVAWIIGIPIIVGIFINAISRAKERNVGHNRCAFCRAGLKKAAGNASFATTCRKCGRDQPWAKTG